MFCPICQGGTRRFGWNRNGSQRYRCDVCRKTFTDEQTRPQDQRCVDPATMLMILNHILEGSSIRSQERVYHVGRNTIISAMVEAGEKCRAFTEKTVQNVPVNDVQCDELWAYVQCKEKTRLRLNKAECFGDVWCFTAIERHTKLILTWHVGKRTPTDTAIFADNLYHATKGRFQLTTDGFTPYRTVIPAILGTRVDFATLVKVYGDSEDDRRYSCGTVIDTVATPRLGNPDEHRICTSHVERSNKTLRMQIRRLTRLTDGHSKKWTNHEAAMALFITYYNFCRIHGTIKMTPAQKSGLITPVVQMPTLYPLPRAIAARSTSRLIEAVIARLFVQHQAMQFRPQNRTGTGSMMVRGIVQPLDQHWYRFMAEIGEVFADRRDVVRNVGRRLSQIVQDNRVDDRGNPGGFLLAQNRNLWGFWIIHSFRRLLSGRTFSNSSRRGSAMASR